MQNKVLIFPSCFMIPWDNHCVITQFSLRSEKNCKGLHIHFRKQSKDSKTYMVAQTLDKQFFLVYS